MALVIFSEGQVLVHILDLTRRAWIGLILLTLFHSYLSMVSFLKALQRLAAIQAALSNYLISFSGLPIAALGLGERLKPCPSWGGILVLSSTLLTLWDAPRPATSPDA